jgi:hypothetical protein
MQWTSGLAIAAKHMALPPAVDAALSLVAALVIVFAISATMLLVCDLPSRYENRNSQP